MAKTSQSWSGVILALSPDYVQHDLQAATALTPSENPSTFLCDLKQDWAIGLVPHGGYLAALIAQAAKCFSALLHAELNQPDLITLHQEFISACVFGPAEITGKVLSRGRQYSTLRVQLYQYPGHDRTEKAILRVEALVRQGSLKRESGSGGMSLITHKPSSKWPLLEKSICVERKDPPGLYERRTSYGKVVFMLGPETDEVGKGSEGPSVRTQWICWRDRSKRFDDIASLAYLADTHRPLIEAYDVGGNWFPTLNMSLDVKMTPPEGGWEWLFMRIEIHCCMNGRFDYDVFILDEQGDLVALSRHANLIVGFERNYKRSSAAAAKI